MNLSGQESGAVTFPREQYEALESAVMESARGRWFLAEYARRNRAADTMMLLDALKRLENVAGAHAVQSGQSLPDLEELAAAIRATKSEIASTHNDLLPDAGYLAADGAVYDCIAADAKAAASEIAKRSMSLRVVAGGLKAASADGEHVEAVEANARSLETLSWSQEVLSERIAKAMGLLSHLDEALTGSAATSEDSALAERQMPYFSHDEDLFDPMPEVVDAPVEPSSAEAAPAREKPRIVVIRRGKDDPVDIPLSG
jgi:hypothetical protein